MIIHRKKIPLYSLLVIGFLLVGCSTAATEPPRQETTGSGGQVVPLAHVSVLPTPTPVDTPAVALPADTPAPTLPADASGPTVPAESPISTPAQLSTYQLVVLHTNDNWGETEPCG